MRTKLYKRKGEVGQYGKCYERNGVYRGEDVRRET